MLVNIQKKIKGEWCSVLTLHSIDVESILETLQTHNPSDEYRIYGDEEKNI